MSVFIGYPSFMAYQMMKGKKGNNDGFPSIPGMIARYSALGLTNEQMATNPVWVDKTDNGHDLQMKNFAWKEMSGVNGYVQNFNNFKNNTTVDKVRIDEQSSNSIKVTILTTGISNAIYIPKNIYQFNKSYSIKISSEGYNEGDPSFVELLNSEEWTYSEGEQPVINRQFSRLLALDALDLEANSEINTYNLTPSEALQVKERHPKWKIGIDVVKGHRYQYGEDLWEVLQDHKTQENWKPSLETASLWKRVDEEHAGTNDDPIPYAPPMEIFKDKYYIQSKVLYKCIRDSGQPLSHNLSDLVGNYVEKA